MQTINSPTLGQSSTSSTVVAVYRGPSYCKTIFGAIALSALSKIYVYTQTHARKAKHKATAQTSTPLPLVVHLQPTPPSALKNERIQMLFLKILTTPFLNNSLLSFFPHYDFYTLCHGLGHINKMFKKTFILEETPCDLIENNKPLSLQTAFRVRYLLGIFDKGYLEHWDIVNIIKLEESLNIKICAIAHIHRLKWPLEGRRWDEFWESHDLQYSRERCRYKHELYTLENYTALKDLVISGIKKSKYLEKPYIPSFTKTLNSLVLDFDCLDFSLESLPQLTRLKFLELRIKNVQNLEINFESLKIVSQLSSLNSLTITFSRFGYASDSFSITDAALDALEGLTALQTLEFSNCNNVNANKLVRLANRLQNLKCTWCNQFLQNEDANELIHFTRLQNLSINNCNITNVALSAINKLHSLQKLTLDGQEIGLALFRYQQKNLAEPPRPNACSVQAI